MRNADVQIWKKEVIAINIELSKHLVGLMFTDRGTYNATRRQWPMGVEKEDLELRSQHPGQVIKFDAFFIFIFWNSMHYNF